ncbi:MAG: endonuclease/exonuclease/phosphatase family protein [Alphaproteobacteria bacterium]|nr:endonuclease/exonuclease/phosphatase family protein [Alphaproteobacteria bacterium]
MRIISWNLLRRTGAAAADVAALIARHRPDLLLMQEATKDMESLPALVGGHIYRRRLPGRIHGLAAWAPGEMPRPKTLMLPVSALPGGLPPRVAQIVRLGGITFANVHLSHGQILNRLQLAWVVEALDGPAAVIGDYNAVGPILLPGFRDVGPRRPTHHASNVVPFRLDRCLARGLACHGTHALERGPSDHRPIMLELEVMPVAATPERRRRRWRLGRTAPEGLAPQAA